MYAFIADVHLGTKLQPTDYIKSLDMFLGIIKKHKEECHAIFVCGDLFDHRLTVDEAQFAGLFLLNLVQNNCSKDKNKQHVPVHFIHGTYTHDYEQYNIFLPILSKIPNVKIFYTKETCIGELDGKSILYLPQIYGNFDYSPYLDSDRMYDIIIGHGPISSKTKEPCRTSQYEIMHATDKLGKISKICVFGHYHGYTDFGNNVYYAGPWLRWKYGEDEPRKFFLCNDKMEVELIDNPNAMEYKTVNITDAEELRSYISNDITEPHRFFITTTTDQIKLFHAIINTNKKNTNLTYHLSTTDDIKPEDVVTTTHSNVDLCMDPIQSLIAYINDKYKVDVSKEIHQYDEKINKGVNKDDG